MKRLPETDLWHAGGDIEVKRNEPVVITATSINEPAMYNWYNSEGNLVYEGTELQIPNAVASNYKLDVISELVGFKDYDNVNISVLPGKIEQIEPHPESKNAVIKYTINGAIRPVCM